VENGEASVPVQGGQVQWWVELLDESQAVLATIGSEEEPLTDIAAQAQALQGALKQGTGKPALTPMRTAGYVLLGVAAGSGAVGGLFGLRSNSARSEVENAPVDEQGVTVGLTQRQAQQLDERARSSARVANVLFGVAGVAAVAGGTFWVLGAPVKVSASPAGVALEGTLP
jgi:nucleoid-associated protein YgaU